MTGIALLDGIEFAASDSVQRGLAYGDGVFETMRGRAGRVALWSAHVARLAHGCGQLGLEAPAAALLIEERDRMLSEQPDAVLKLMVWRRAAGYGYDPAGERSSHRCWTSAPLPTPDRAPLRVRWCELRLARQPRLAGLKTLNRLEQVLARGEWTGTEWDEGLLCDAAGGAISAISGNLFVVIDGRLATPALDYCGVAGVLRGWILERASSHVPVDVRAILRDELEGASELFVTNAVRGIRAIGTLGNRNFVPGPVATEWIARAHAAGLMDAEGKEP